MILKRLVERTGTGKGLTVYCLDVALETLEQMPAQDGGNQWIALLSRIRAHGPPHGKERCRQIAPGLYEFKPGSYRVLFFYDPGNNWVVVIAHSYKKQSKDLPPREKQVALDRMAEFVKAKKERKVTYGVV